MDELIDEVRRAFAAGLHYLALFGALTLPDICGALATDGKATKSKYKDWLSANVPAHAEQADLIYGLRCSLLHQGRALPHGQYPPIAFTVPNQRGTEVHNLTLVWPNDERVFVLGVESFVDEMTDGAQQWFRQFGSTQTVKNNVEKFARLRPDGLAPFFGGMPVIA